MHIDLTLQETCALYTMLAEQTSDIIIKTDRGGFVTHLSPAAATSRRVGEAGLFGRHLVDLVDPHFAPEVRAEHEAVMRGASGGRRMEIMSTGSLAGGPDLAIRAGWFELRLRQLVDAAGRVYGALGHMRSIEEKRCLEERLFAAAMTDQLTGFTNRRACLSMMQHLLSERVGGSIALFALDHFKAINMRFGQRFGDEVLVVFADLLRTMTRRQDILCRMGAENLAVLMPATDPAEALALCEPVIEALAESAREAGGSDFAISASCGLVSIGGTLDHTLKRAELALFTAKAKGRNRIEAPGDAGVVRLAELRRRA